MHFGEVVWFNQRRGFGWLTGYVGILCTLVYTKFPFLWDLLLHFYLYFLKK